MHDSAVALGNNHIKQLERMLRVNRGGANILWLDGCLSQADNTRAFGHDGRHSRWDPRGRYFTLDEQTDLSSNTEAYFLG